MPTTHFVALVSFPYLHSLHDDDTQMTVETLDNIKVFQLENKSTTDNVYYTFSHIGIYKKVSCSILCIQVCILYSPPPLPHGGDGLLVTIKIWQT